jgi:acyl-CoA thioesterase FadM
MYPVLRLVKEFIKYRNAPALPFDGTHVSHHMCLPWDLDLWMELNNGRTLTLYDLGRMTLAKRAGLISAMELNNWGMTMAGACVRYRRRIRVFDVVEMHSRLVCWDDKFLYIEQSMWRKDGECANNVVYRAAVTSNAGIVPPEQVAKDIFGHVPKVETPDWIAKWIETERLRPWPPQKADTEHV